MKKSDFQGVVDYADDPTTETRKQHAKFYCHRWGANVTKSLCVKCKSKDPVIIGNFISTAEKRKIEWCANRFFPLQGKVGFGSGAACQRVARDRLVSG